MVGIAIASQRLTALLWLSIAVQVLPTAAQTPPGPNEILRYGDLFKAVAEGDIDQVRHYIDQEFDLEKHDQNGRTALLIATHFSHKEIIHLLLKHGADSNAMDNQDYDMITIAAVNDDVELIKLGLQFGADPAAITSPYEGTALIAAAHLGHMDVVDTLIKAGAPLDHVNNIGWTALIESIVLGMGGQDHVGVLNLLIEAGADLTITDREGNTPLELAKIYGYSEMITILENASVL